MLDECCADPSNAASYPHDASAYLHEYLLNHLSDPGFQQQEVENYANSEGIADWPEHFEDIWDILQNTYREAMQVLEKQIVKIESIRSVSRPHISPQYPHPVFDGKIFDSEVIEDFYLSGNPWLSECMGLPHGHLYIDTNVSNVHSVHLQYGTSYVNFQIAHVVLRENARKRLPDAWEGIRSLLFIQDINIRSKERREGLTEQHCLFLLTDIARQNHCVLIADVVIGNNGMSQQELADGYKEEGFSFPSDDVHAVKVLDRGDVRGEKWYRGVLQEDDQGKVTVNGGPLPPAFEVMEVSPTGLSWGYGGHGPTQLAVAITCDLYGQEYIWDEINGGYTSILRAIEKMVEELNQEEDFTLRASEIRQYVDQFDARTGRSVDL